MRTLHIRRRALAVLAAVLLAGTGAAFASGATTAECTPPTDPSSLAQQQAWQACRFDALEAKVDALAKPAVTVTETATTTATATVTKTATQTVTAAPTTSAPTTSATTTAAPTTSTTTASPTSTATATPTSSPTTTAPATSGKGTLVRGRYFPNADTTGVPAGTTLTPYTGSCTLSDTKAAPLTIDAKVITCDQFRILQPGVTITRSVINGTIYSDCCYLNGSFTLTDSEVRGPNSAATVVGEARFKLLRVDVTGGSRSVNCMDCEIRDSYIHGQYTDQRGIDHESGIRQDYNGTIVGNTITCDATPVPPDAGCSAAISGYGDFGTVNNNTIEDNLIGVPAEAAGYCVYGGSTPGKPYPNAHHIVFRNNIFQRGETGQCGIWGPVTSFDSSATGNVWTGNIWDDDGGPVRATM